MTTALIYIYPNINSLKYDNMAKRFVVTYMENPPGESDHELYVVVNGGRLHSRQERLFEPLVPRFIHHDNSGRDLGGFRMAAATVPCDLMVCLGAPVRCHAAGWLDVVVDSYVNNGPGLYGNFCFHVPAPHVRTTFFWCPPALYNAYPYYIADGTRYEVEHGRTSLTYWVMGQGLPVLQVTMAGVYALPDWHHVEPKDCLVLDQHWEGLGI